jgi:hypothetical protein
MEDCKIAPVEVGDVFRLYGEQFRHQHKLPAHYRKTMFALQYCRTPAMGSHADTCDQCGHVRITNNSCRNRHCPKCQGLNRAKWVDKLACDLLPVRYFHIVFTIPSELNRLVLVNRECLYDILFTAASQSLITLARDPKHLGAYTGLVAVLHTWGQNLMEHPHLHTLVPAGGWDETAQYWKSSRKKFFIHVKVISRVFRGKFLALLKKAYQENQLKFEGEINFLALKNNFKNLLDTLYNKDWVVYCKNTFKNSTQIINYLGRYSHRVAISNNRILGIENDQVAFRWKDYNDTGKKKIMILPAVEFIRRFFLHVLPKGFCKIRYFGIFAVRNRNTLLPCCRIAFGHFFSKSKLAGLPWQELLLLLTRVDLSICPVCNSGKMMPVPYINCRRAPPQK